MSYTSLLIDTATVRHFTVGAQDAYGNPIETWTDHLTNQACRLNEVSGVEVKVGSELVIADCTLFVEDINITEQDRVIVGGITYEILLVRRFQDGSADHHKQLYLRTTR